MNWDKNKLQKFLKSAEALLFDLDGTIFDLNVDWMSIKRHFRQYTKETYGQDLPSNRFYKNFKFIEKNFGEKALQYYVNHLASEELKTVRANLSTPKWLAEKGMKKLLECIEQDGIMCGIVSSNFHETVEEIVHLHKLNPIFLEIVGRNDVENAKPDPEGLLKIIEKHNLNPEKTLYVGDTITDKQAAKRANVKFIYIEELEELFGLN